MSLNSHLHMFWVNAAWILHSVYLTKIQLLTYLFFSRPIVCFTAVLMTKHACYVSLNKFDLFDVSVSFNCSFNQIWIFLIISLNLNVVLVIDEIRVNSTSIINMLFLLSFSKQRDTQIFTRRFLTDINWIFKINEICISNRKPANTLNNRNQCVFDEYFLQIL